MLCGDNSRNILLFILVSTTGNTFTVFLISSTSRKVVFCVTNATDNTISVQRNLYQKAENHNNCGNELSTRAYLAFIV